MARVPITVEPGAYNAKSITLINNQRLEDPLDLKVPHSRRVSLFPVGASVPADNSVTVPVRAYVTESNGTPDTKATVSFTVASGTVTEATHLGGGVYEAQWTPAFGSTEATASVQVSVADARPRYSLDVTMVPGRAASLGLTEPPTLAPGSSSFATEGRRWTVGLSAEPCWSTPTAPRRRPRSRPRKRRLRAELQRHRRRHHQPRRGPGKRRHWQPLQPPVGAAAQ